MSAVQNPVNSGVGNTDSRSLQVIVVAAIGIIVQFVLPLWRTEADSDWGISSESLSRSDVSLLLSLSGDSQLPLYAGILGFALCAATILLVPRRNSWRGPLAGIVALASLYLPVGLTMSAEMGIGESAKFFHVGTWAVVVAAVVALVLGVRARV